MTKNYKLDAEEQKLLDSFMQGNIKRSDSALNDKVLAKNLATSHMK